MAHPFGGHPKLIDYIAWCNQQGCTTKSSITQEDGKMITCQRLVAPSKRHLIVVGVGMNEYLMPTTVAYYDRRLGLDSPFAKIGDGSEKPDLS